MRNKLLFCALFSGALVGCQFQVGGTSADGLHTSKAGGTIDANGSNATFVPSVVDGNPPAAALRDAASDTQYDTSLLFDVTGPSVINPGGCYPYTFDLVDALRAPTTASETAYISPRVTGGGEVFFDAECRASASRITIAEGGSQLNVYVRVDEPSNANVYANGDNLAIQGTRFTTLGNNVIDDSVAEVAAMQDGSGRFYAVGNFDYYGAQNAPGIARFNADGSLDTTFDPGSGIDNGTIESIYVYRDGTERVLIAGSFTSFNGQTHHRILRLLADGRADPDFQTAGFNSTVYDARVDANGSIYAGGAFSTADGQPSRYLARLSADGRFDSDFDVGGYNSFNSYVLQLLPLSDGSILVGGYFSSYRGTSKLYFAKLDNDGVLDADFPQTSNGSTTSSYVYAMRVDPTDPNKVYIGGRFNYYGTDNVPYIVRIDSNTGTRDTSFAPDFSYAHYTYTIDFADDGSDDVLVGGYYFRRLQRANGNAVYKGIAGYVYSIAVLGLGNGQSVFGGTFISTNNATLGTGYVSNRYLVKVENNGAFSSDIGFLGTGTIRVGHAALPLDDGTGDTLLFGTIYDFMGSGENYVAKIQPDGSIDTGYTGSANNNILGIHRVGDKSYIHGYFTNYNGNTVYRIARINSGDGSYDASFDPGTGANSNVRVARTDADGNVYAGGDFTSFNGTTARYFVKLLPDGSVDTDFMTNFGYGFNSSVYAIAIDTEGKIWVGGAFSTISGQTSRYLVRLNTDGTVDHAFASDLNHYVYSLLAAENGRMYVGGQFSYYQGYYRPYLMRLNANASYDGSFVTNGNISSHPYLLRYYGDNGDLLVGTRKELFRMTDNAALNPSFNTIRTDGIVYDVAPAADASQDLFVTGAFVAVDAQVLGTWNIVRLKADGTTD